MTRKNIFEILNASYDINKEFVKIIRLCNSDIYRGYGYSLAAENLVDKHLLKKWKQRKSYLSCEEMLGDIKSHLSSNDINSKIIILEYYVNILHLIESNKGFLFANNSLQPTDKFGLVQENICILLEHLNLEKLIIQSEEKVLLVPKSPAATAVAEISSDETGLAILKYHHASMKGNLEEKKKLLYQISLEYEPLLQSPIEGYKDFFEKTNALLNNLHIRHNNKAKENNKNKVINIDDQELERWYDELYQLLLFCVLIKNNLERKNDVDKFLKELKGANT